MRAQHVARRASCFAAIAVEHRVLAPHVVERARQPGGMTGAEIAGIGIARHEPQRGPLAAAGQDDGRAWLLPRRRRDQLVRGLVKATVEGERFGSPHTADDLDCAHLVYCHSADQLQAARELMGDRAHKSPGRAREIQVSERRFYLKKTPLRLLPLTPTQSMRVNSALARNEDPVPWLSARQWQLAQELTQTLQEDPDAVAGLTPPDSLDRLASYDRRLRRRLDQISSQTTAQ